MLLRGVCVIEISTRIHKLLIRTISCDHVTLLWSNRQPKCSDDGSGLTVCLTGSENKAAQWVGEYRRCQWIMASGRPTASMCQDWKPSLHYKLRVLSVLPTTTVNVWAGVICHKSARPRVCRVFLYYVIHHPTVQEAFKSIATSILVCGADQFYNLKSV